MNRIKELDVLRGMAIILVLFRHGSSDNFIQSLGWIGVDLFFVLSGYLITNLILSEYKDTGKLNTKRFIIRRGFKIYPSFYIFIVATFIVHYFTSGTWIPTNQLLHEVFFLQSYLPGIWPHTWSLAVEEHFYIAMAIWNIIVIKIGVIEKKGIIFLSFVLLLFITLLIRIVLCAQSPILAHTGFTQTHLRWDGIIIGSMIAYIQRYTNPGSLLAKKWYLIIPISLILILSPFIMDIDPAIVNSVGLLSINLGFGLILLLVLNQNYTSKLVNIPILKYPLNLIA